MTSQLSVLFIDAGVQDYQQLLAGLNPGVQAYVLTAQRDGVEQITEILSCVYGHRTVGAVHIVAHGAPGCLYLGNTELSLASLNRYAQLLKTWPDAALFLYGCNVAVGDAGEEFINKLHQLTGAEIAASKTLTGNTALGGNWHLEFSTQAFSQRAFLGANDVAVMLQATNWPHTLVRADNGFSFSTPGTETAGSGPGDVGKSRRFLNVATINGNATSLDAVVTIEALSDTSMPVELGQSIGSEVVTILLARDGSSSVSGFEGESATLRIDFFEAGTNTPIEVEAEFTFADIDFVSPGSPGSGAEAIEIDKDRVASYSISSSPTSDIDVVDNGSSITFTNDSSSGGTADQERWATVLATSSTSLTIETTARDGNTGYSLDTLVFSNTPITVSSPIVDLNSAGSSGDSDRNFSTSFTGGGSAVAIADTVLSDVSDAEDNITLLTITTGLISDGDAEVLTIAGEDFLLGTTKSVNSVSVGGETVDINYVSGTGTFAITHSSGSATPISQSALDALIRGITYANTATNPTVGNRTITFQASDASNLASALATATVDVTAPSNTPPVISTPTGSPAAVNFAENGTGTVVDVESSDTEDGAETNLTYSLSGADASLFSIDTNGNISFDASPDFENPSDAGGNNVYDLTVTATDSGGLTDTQDIQVTVTDAAENTPPVISTPTGSPAAVDFAENGTGTVVDVESSDTQDGVETNLTYSLSGTDASLFSIDANGNITFDAAPDFENPSDAGGNNVYDLTVTTTDSGGLTDTQDIQVTVTDAADNTPPVISTPTGSPAAVNFAENGTGTVVDVESSDTEDGAETNLTYSLSGTDASLFSIDTSGNITFDAAPDFETPGDVGGDNVYDLTVTTTDTGGLTDTQDVQVTVTDINDVPSVLDLDADNSSGATNADYQTTFTEGGAAVAIADIDTVITDADSTTLEAATVTFTNPQSNDTLSIGTVEVYANGSIVAPTVISGDIIYNVAFGPGSEIVITLVGSDTINNYEAAIKDISFSNTSDDPNTTNRVFNISVNDGEDASNIAISTISVVEENDPPVAGNDTATTPEDTAVSFNPLTNDSDVDGTLDPTSVVFVNEPAGSTLSNGGKTLTVPGEGQYGIDPNNGQITFTPELNYFGRPTPVEYQVADDDGATATGTVEVTVNDINDPPTAANDTFNTYEDTPVSFNPLTNDIDVDGNLDPTSVVFVNAPGGSTLSNGGKTLTVPGEGQYVIDANSGQITFTPELNYFGRPTPVEYQVADDDGATATGTVEVTVNDINDPPTATNDTVNTNEDTPVSFNPLTNDSDVDGNLDPTSVVFVNEPAGSTLSNGGKTLTVPGEGQYEIDPNNGQITFTPELNYFGRPTPVEYQVADDDGDTATGTIEVTVNDVNDPPTANNDTINTDEDTAVSFNPLTNDSDVDGTLDPTSVVFVNEPAGSTLSNGGKTLTVPGEGQYGIDPNNGQITFTPELNYFGRPTPVEYQVADDDGATVTAIISATVNDVNDPPVAVDDPITTLEDTAVTFDPLTNDSDVDGTLNPTSVVFVNEPAGATLSTDGKTLTVPGEGEFVINPTDGKITFTPAADFDGTPTPVEYQVTDDDGDTATGNIPVTITPVNDAPVLDLDADDSTETGSDYAGTFTERGDAVPIVDSDLSIIDIDDANLESATITFSNPQLADTLKVGVIQVFANGGVTNGSLVSGGITISVALSIAGEVVLQMSGGATKADYEATIKAISFENAAVPIDTSDRVFTISVNDGDLSSNVGITTLRYDLDGDSIADIYDIDDDNDGIPDTVEASTAINNGDTDGDGILDGFDLDSDGDGLFDVLEAGGTDPDGDGTIGTGPITDSDEDGLADSVDNVDAGGGLGEVINGTPLPLPNKDGDSQPNFQDVDDDNDIVETKYENPDPNGDGNPEDAQDTDGDEIPDYLDNDDDADGVLSEYENPDPNGDGNPEDAQDTDGDNIPDYLDTDDDNDGIDTIDEDANGDGNPLNDDSDGDGVPDYLDLDADNDGILDAEEGNGDTDGDGTPDYLDLDTDGDGLTDLEESGLSTAEVEALDTDGDGVIDSGNSFGPNGLADAVETTAETGEPDYDNDGRVDEPVNTDGDSADDYKDLDTDNDGINDVIEGNGTDANGDGLDDNTNGPDGDGNGLPDALDPNNGGTPVENPDTDGDGVKDFRDLDTDNDGINDVIEGGNSDEDGNGTIDGPDTDGDGIADVVDPSDGFGDNNDGEAPDFDGDGTDNYRDLDTDNDGVFDVIEGGNGDADTNDDGSVDGSDSDGDGIVDAVDPSDGFGDDGSSDIPDTNGDDIPDYLQPGSNNSDGTQGTGGDDVITGDDGDNIINGLSDNDTLDGGDGNDVVNGGSDLDVIFGGTGNDVLNGGSSGDTMRAGAGNDIVNGGSGNDEVYGEDGVDVLNGGSGKDKLYGGLDNDLLSGGSEDDLLFGGAGRDLLRGGSGDDVLTGGDGSDLLSGGQGRDIFAYTQASEFGDIVQDFEIVRDRIDLSAIYNGNASLGSNVTAQQVGNHTSVLAEDVQVALLLNVNANTLDTSNFVF